jgi:hypothetical protein
MAEKIGTKTEWRREVDSNPRFVSGTGSADVSPDTRTEMN